MHDTFQLVHGYGTFCHIKENNNIELLYIIAKIFLFDLQHFYCTVYISTILINYNSFLTFEQIATQIRVLLDAMMTWKRSDRKKTGNILYEIPIKEVQTRLRILVRKRYHSFASISNTVRVSKHSSV